jgi:hypothetical protein
VAELVNEWAAGKDVMALLQSIPEIMPERCLAMNYKVPTSIASMTQLVGGWVGGWVGG